MIKPPHAVKCGIGLHVGALAQNARASGVCVSGLLRRGGALASRESKLILSPNKFEGTLPEGVALWSSS